MHWHQDGWMPAVKDARDAEGAASLSTRDQNLANKVCMEPCLAWLFQPHDMQQPWAIQMPHITHHVQKPLSRGFACRILGGYGLLITRGNCLNRRAGRHYVAQSVFGLYTMQTYAYWYDIIMRSICIHVHT